jgi:hypothetical protein
VSRSVHTRPVRLRAADRLRRPGEPRGAADASRPRRLLRELKELGIAAVDDGASLDDSWELPRIDETCPRPGHHHPASAADVAETLRFFGETCVYGLRSVELRQACADGPSLLGRLLVPGCIQLYDQPHSPWRLPGRLEDEVAEQLTAAGARLELSEGVAEVHWPGTTLRDHMLLDVLMHEVGHHLLQHHKGKRRLRIARTRDHEAFADAFARKCREVYMACARS